MTVKQSPPQVLAIYPPRIVGATDGVISESPPPPDVPVQGVPLDLFQNVTRDNGSLARAVTLSIDPPADDYEAISYWLNGVEIQRKVIPPADRNLPITFDVFESDLLDGSHNIVTYKIHRASGNDNESVALWVLYSATLPGGNDVPGTDDHPFLAISLPAELGDPPHIGKDEAAKGVIVTLIYPYSKAYDVITLQINRERFFKTVGRGEGGQPVRFEVTQAMLEQVGNHERCPFSFTVVDQLRNATHKRRWSRTIEADVDLDSVTLTAPDIAEDPDDHTDDPGTIDLGKVKDFLYVLVHVFSPLWEPNDIVQVSYTSTPLTGPVVTHSVEETVGRLPFTHKLQVPLAKVLANSEVSVIYKLVRDGKVIGVSTPAVAQVIGEYPIELIVDTTPLTISGQNISIAGSGLPWTLTGVDLPGTFVHRPASGGVPPITFTSSDESIASVDHSGMIRSEGNGKATVTVSDAGGQTKTIDISCENIITYLFNPTTSTHQAYEAWRTSINAHHPITQSGEVIHIDLLVRKFTSHTLTNTWAGPVVVTNPIYAWAFTIPFQHINTLLLTTRCPGLSWRVINSAGAPGSRSEDQ
ncbi:hypothetical protein [Pseudomonas sp. 008]|uniref:hypothetical protein n=1 Tax=Pseudomonas sp. 008 TaxID=2803906 RepID=UPI00194F7AC5|nr:hypothetical protein [Pseudomonas sp. 008]GID08213.1 hypothetical protein TMM008_54150 [Pseudomonas sp. 008]